MTGPETAPSAPPDNARSVEELIASVRSNLDVIRDAMRQPATPDSHTIVSDLMLEVKQAQEKLQSKASELVESGQFGSTDNIFEAIDQVSQIEPRFAEWSRNVGSGDGHRQSEVDATADALRAGDASGGEGGGNVEKKKKKKKKAKRVSPEGEDAGRLGTEGFPAGDAPQNWDAFGAPPADGPPGNSAWPAQPQQQTQQLPFALPPPPPPIPTPAVGRLRLGMAWETLGPLLCEPGSSEEQQKAKLSELFRQSVSTCCNINPNRIRITGISV